LVTRLGAFALLIEIVKFGYELTIKKLQLLKCEPRLRMNENRVYETDNGNYIVDCLFNQIENTEDLHNKINWIPGIVDNGLFINMASKVVVGYRNGDIKEFENNN